MNRGYKLATAVAAVLVMIAPAGATELVVNGGFETGDFTGWTYNGNNTDYLGVGGGWAASGANAAYFGTIGGVSSISQAIATVAGQTYDVSFYLQNSAAGVNSFSVLFGDGTPQISYVNQDVLPWTKLTFQTVATSASTLLKFSFRNDPSFYYLDDVSVQGRPADAVSAVPEPEGWMMMIAGFGLTGLAMRRNLKRRPVSALLFDHR